jgi:hypothetical protein
MLPGTWESGDTVKEIQRTYSLTRFVRPDLKHLELIAIDEIAIGKGIGISQWYLILSPALLSLSVMVEALTALSRSGGA